MQRHISLQADLDVGRLRLHPLQLGHPLVTAAWPTKIAKARPWQRQPAGQKGVAAHLERGLAVTQRQLPQEKVISPLASA